MEQSPQRKDKNSKGGAIAHMTVTIIYIVLFSIAAFFCLLTAIIIEDKAPLIVAIIAAVIDGLLIWRLSVIKKNNPEFVKERQEKRNNRIAQSKARQVNKPVRSGSVNVRPVHSEKQAPADIGNDAQYIEAHDAQSNNIQLANKNWLRNYFKTKTVSGLPFPQNSNCKMYLSSEKIKFVFNDASVILKSDKIVSISIDTSKNIQKVAVSSSGGALAGAMMFGTIGAAVGGRTKTKEIKTKTKYLSIVYKDKNGQFANIVLEPDKNDIYNLKSSLKQYNNLASTLSEDIEL